MYQLKFLYMEKKEEREKKKEKEKKGRAGEGRAGQDREGQGRERKRREGKVIFILMPLVIFSLFMCGITLFVLSLYQLLTFSSVFPKSHLPLASCHKLVPNGLRTSYFFLKVKTT